jgi:hypothetical protein
MKTIKTRWLAGALLLCLLVLLTAACGGGGETGTESDTDSGDTAVESDAGTVFSYRFADKDEAAELLLSNRAYYENMTQNDLNYRLQELDATLEELEAFAATQTLDFTDEEKAAVDEAMAFITQCCREKGYKLPATDDIVFAKTTMKEESDGAAAYTHGKQIYLGESLFQNHALSVHPHNRLYFRTMVAHELFHCLTRQHPDFRADMYALLGFTVEEEDFDFPREVRDRIISNPDVEHHNSYAAFLIDGEMRDCTLAFVVKPFQQPGDTFFEGLKEGETTGLVPVDDLSTVYTIQDAANFWDVFGKNTNYVIDPEETLAENFSYTIVYPPDNMGFQTPELLAAIDTYLRER